MSQQGDVSVSRPSPPRTCASCGQPIVSDQMVEHAGVIYCTQCVGAALEAEAARKREAGQAGGIYTAVLLSLIPGLGQMYLGQMTRGLLILIAFVVIMSGVPPFLGNLQSGAGFVLYVWNLFDAYWLARRLDNEEMPALPPLSQEQQWESAVTPAWAIVLIVLGIIFLLNNYGVEWLTFDRAWPAALLALGLWLLISFALSWRVRQAGEEVSDGKAC